MTFAAKRKTQQFYMKPPSPILKLHYALNVGGGGGGSGLQQIRENPATPLSAHKGKHPCSVKVTFVVRPPLLPRANVSINPAFSNANPNGSALATHVASKSVSGLAREPSKPSSN